MQNHPTILKLPLNLEFGSCWASSALGIISDVMQRLQHVSRCQADEVIVSTCSTPGELDRATLAQRRARAQRSQSSQSTRSPTSAPESSNDTDQNENPPRDRKANSAVYDLYETRILYAIHHLYTSKDDYRPIICLQVLCSETKP